MFQRESEQDRIQRWNALTAIIQGAIAPVLTEQQKLDMKLQKVVDDHVTKAELAELRDDLRAAQSSTYTREMVDGMFRIRDERISRVQAIGTIVVSVASVMWGLLASAQILHIIP